MGVGGIYIGVISMRWNLWGWLVGVVVRRYIYFLILLIPTPLVSVIFCLLFVHFLFFVLVIIRFRDTFYCNGVHRHEY